MDEEEATTTCEHEGCISWLKPFGYAFKPRQPYVFCRKCGAWIIVDFK